MSNTIKRESLISRASDILKPKRARQLHRSVSEDLYDFDADSWTSEQHGEDYHYSRGQRYSNAKRAYQAAAALAHQKVTHKPFYMEDLGQEDEPQVETSLEEEMVNMPPKQYMRPTRFYPNGGQSESVSRVQGIGRAQMQRIYPSYELSTAETRESGLGPGIEVMEGYARGKKTPKT